MEVTGRIGPADPAAPLPGFGGLAGRSFLYSLGAVAQKAVGILLVPALARLLTNDEFGRLEVLSTLATTTANILTLGLDIVVTRRWADLERPRRRQMFGTWLTLSVGIGIVAVIGAAVFGGAISDGLFESRELSTAIQLAALFALADLIYIVGLTALRNEDRPKAYAVIAVGTAVANGLVVGLLVINHRDETAVILGITLAMAMGAVAAVAASRTMLLARPQRREARILLLATLPLVPGLLLTWGGDLVNRAVLLTVAGPTEVGYFSIALRFGTAGLLAVTGFQLAWHPRAYAVATREGGYARLSEDGATIMVSLVGVTAALAATSPELLRIVAGSRYEDALPAVGLALLVPITTGALLLATLPSAVANRMRDLGAATAVAAASAIVLTIVLAAPWGARGAAIAQVAGPAIGAAVAIFLGRRNGPSIPFRWARSAVLALAGGGVTVAATSPDGGAPVVVRVLLVAALAGLITALEGRSVRSAARRLSRLRLRRETG